MLIGTPKRLLLKQILQIADVPGIDAIFLRPLDLSCNVGKMGHSLDRHLFQILADAEEVVQNSGCFLAGFGGPVCTVHDMLEAGYSLACSSVDQGLLKEAA